MASWMLSELFEAGGADVNVTVTGGTAGVFQVLLDGQIVFDKKAEDNQTPTLARAKEIKAQSAGEDDGGTGGRPRISRPISQATNAPVRLRRTGAFASCREELRRVAMATRKRGPSLFRQAGWRACSRSEMTRRAAEHRHAV